MQSQGSTSSQPSFDSLSSSDSLLQSDSEQAEDEESIFMAGGSPSVIIGGGGRGGACAGRGGAGGGGGGGSGGGGGAGGSSVRACGSESPGSRWTDNGYTDKEEEEEEEEDRGSGGGRPGTAAGDGQRPKSQGDLLFAKKCAELQGFVNPLLELLSGLKRGRFERGLTGFQQSVAMDRIQRIVGVLQRPSCGEKYLSTLLQVEMMLKLWFPQITPGNGPAPSPAPPALSFARSMAPHKHRDQSHIPVKKRRLSWTDAESPSPSPVAAKRHHAAAADNAERSAPTVSPPGPPRPPGGAGGGRAEQPSGEDGDGDGVAKGKPSDDSTGRSSEPGLTWVRVAPILSPSKACAPPKSPGASTAAAASAAAPAATSAAACDIKNELPAFVPSPAGTGSPAMQDSSVTSTTPHKHHTTDEPTPTRCQSPAAGGQQTEGKTAESCPRESPPAPAPSPPPSKICPPTPLDT